MANERLIMAVALDPFQIGINQFCRLIPLMTVEGIPLDPLDFPNNGEVWWMLTSQTSHLGKPGRLVVCQTEPANAFDPEDIESSQFQVVLDSVSELRIEEGLNILKIPDDSLNNLRMIITDGFTVTSEFPPTPNVLVEWRGDLYGPLSANLSEYSDPYRISFETKTDDMSILRIPRDVVSKDLVGCYVEQDVDVDLAGQGARIITQRLLLGDGYRTLVSLDHERVTLEPVDRKLIRLARGILNRKARQQLRSILDELKFASADSPDHADLLDCLDEVKVIVDNQEEGITRVTHALLESEVIGEERIRKAEEVYAARYISEKSAELQAKINERVNSHQEDLRKLKQKQQSLAVEIRSEELRARDQLKSELDEERRLADVAISNERKELAAAQAQVQRQKQFLQENLEQVAEKMRDSGDEIVNQFLMIAPLLRIFEDDRGMARSINTSTGNEPPESTPADHPTYVFPRFITSRATDARGEISEESFFDRFLTVLSNSGFTYDLMDLARYHLSVKSGVLTVLGGPSGIGKSSLPLLYSRALSGEEYQNGRPDCLMITVNPSWLEIRDLIGHLNSLDGRYYPADSGLYQMLICACGELEIYGHETGVHMACLDEMNLAHVEHYFSDLMMLLERGEEHRILSCFSHELASDECQFRDWDKVKLSPALRFTGTVNFDETTRSLSDRFLDRVNLVQLKPSSLAIGGNPDDSILGAPGRMISLSDFLSWRGVASLSPELATLFDDFRPILYKLGSSISPRVYRSICEYVGGSEPILPANTAFDLQIVQRVIPKIRNLSTREHFMALDELIKLLEKSTICPFDGSLEALVNLREAGSDLPWGMEED